MAEATSFRSAACCTKWCRAKRRLGASQPRSRSRRSSRKIRRTWQGAAGKFPPDVDRVITHCIEKRPEERFQSARDLAFALRTIASTTGAVQAVAKAPQHRWRTAIWVTGVAVLLLGGVFFWLWNGQSTGVRSVAVLPFINVGGDPNAEYLSDGITEGIINNLAQLPNLAVMSRSSVYRYKHPDVDPQAAGRDLKVEAVLMGRVTHRGEQLSVSAELVETRSNRQIWGEQYNRRLTDVMAIQEQISREISDKLRVRLTGEDKKRLSKHFTENSEAYGLYLKGRYEWNKQTLDGMQTGIEFFQEAIKKDSRYALAYAGLADSYALLADYNVLPAKEVDAAGQNSGLGKHWRSTTRSRRLMLRWAGLADPGLGLARSREGIQALPGTESKLRHSARMVRRIPGHGGPRRRSSSQHEASSGSGARLTAHQRGSGRDVVLYPPI